MEARADRSTDGGRDSNSDRRSVVLKVARVNKRRERLWYKYILYHVVLIHFHRLMM